MTTNLLALMQVVDGAFPTGAFAHSFGLETYVQAGVVHDGASFGEFLRTGLRLGLGSSDAVAACVAHRAATEADWDAVIYADELLNAMKLSEETRVGSAQVGKRFLATAEDVFSLDGIRELRARVTRGELAGQYAVAFGAVTALLGVAVEDSARAYLHGYATSQASAAVRLIPLGATEAQRVVHSLHGEIQEVATRAVGLRLPDMTSFTPGLEVASMRHASLRARLFMS